MEKYIFEKKAKLNIKRVNALLFTAVFGATIIPAAAFSAVNTFADDITVNSYDVNVRSGPGTDYAVLGYVSIGYEADSTETETDAEGNTWYKIDYNGNTGYISTDFADLTAAASVESDTTETESESEKETDETSGESSEDDSEKETDPENDKETSEEIDEDEEDLEWAAMYTNSQPAWSGTVQSEAEFEAQLAQFPESYQAGLRAVHAVYPNYTFTADYVNMDFEELVDAEIGKKISSYYYDSWKAMYDESYGSNENYDWESGEWINSEGMFTVASREVIEYYIDPRNFLDTSNIYMFMRQSYSSDQTIDDLRSILVGSYLADGYVPNKNEPNDVRLGGDYAKVIMEAAQASGTSPFVLAASILLEHGWSGDTPLISGYYEADDGTVYKDYYNFFDIGATGGDSNNVIQNGLEYAKSAGWTSRYLSIVNGAQWTADGYISNGQDTYYYKEFNVINGWDSLWHQFSTGVLTAYASASFMVDALSGNTYAALNFRIPVYDNMPDATYLPSLNDDLNNYYFTDMQAQGLEPEFSMINREYTMTVNGDTVLSVSVPEWATYEGKNSYSITAGSNTVSLDVRSQTGYLRTYTISVTATQNCTLTVNTFVGNSLNITDNVETEQSGSAVWGDANGDGKVSALDYIAIRNHIMEKTLITDKNNLSAADTNGDGKVSALDYISIKNYIMSL